MKIKFVQNIIDKIRQKDVFEEVSAKQGVNIILQKELLDFKYIHLPALKKHGEIFPKYKNVYQGKDIVLVASGPTVRNYSMIKDAVHIGVNHTYTLEKVLLDYLFIQDNLKRDNMPFMQKNANLYRGTDCKKFYGYHYISKYSIPEFDAIEANAERYYFIDQKIPTSDKVFLSADISTRPLNCWASIVFPAIEFALYTHPRRIYIVGCDCSANGHLVWTNKSAFCSDMEIIKYGWKKIKEYRDSKYPDIEIISVNPVGLKGLFTDVYTKSYVDEHPELLKENVKIMDNECIYNAEQ